ncbi:MAG: Glu/Leu/Phe/Val dehydrogenase [Motiliproteus sp.]|nr:Glu/Leu/Phe/Val dehydrogenase [Motiliproteus sp.]
MADIFEFTDDLGPCKTIHIYEPSVGLKAILVVDNVAAGPAIGGLRMAADVSAAECARLARSMTLKNAAAGLPHGGGKSVLFGDPRMPLAQKELLIRAMACALKNTQEYIFGPDMGTNEQCMSWIHDEINRAVGLPRTLGGIPLDEIGATGRGLAFATEEAINFCDFQLKGARMVIQGFGAVGIHAAKTLTEKGAILVAVADSKGAIHNPRGLDLEQLISLKQSGQSVIEHLAECPQAKQISNEELITVESEIWIPAARPDVIREDNVNQLNTRLVAQGANIAVTEAAEKVLHQRGIISLPDFIANAGGVICGALEYQGVSESAALQSIEEKLRSNTVQVLEIAQSKQIPPRQAALELATARVKAAMSSRRWSVF